MRALWQRHGKADVGVSENGIEELAAKVTGMDLRLFFDQALRSTEDLPLKDLLQTVAIGYELRPAVGSKDEGGTKKSEAKPSRPRADLGVLYKPQGAGVILTAVMDSGPAMEAGLSAGDQLIALDGIKITSSNLDQLLERAQIGQRNEIHVFRRDELMRFNVEMIASEPNSCYLWLLDSAGHEELARLQDWIKT
jgi:predicted metalloprotease with PDZ domain